jgi:hypothetical protein
MPELSQTERLAIAYYMEMMSAACWQYKPEDIAYWQAAAASSTEVQG